MPNVRKSSAGADAGQHQDLRRLQCAGAEDDFAAGAQDLALPSCSIFDADGAAALKQYPPRARAAFDPQIGASAA